MFFYFIYAFKIISDCITVKLDCASSNFTHLAVNERITVTQGYAVAAGVNFIAANLHQSSRGFCGSGVYGWDGIPRAFRCTHDNTSALVVAEILTKLPPVIGNCKFSGSW